MAALTRGASAAVLTVSDGVARGERPDASGDLLVAELARLGVEVRYRDRVADEPEAVVARLIAWCDGPSPPDLILTTGGTGLGPRDRTPEATAQVLERQAPGLAEWLRAEGRAETLTAVLSRGLAGVRGRTLVVNLPGSPAGARSGLRSLSRVLDHALHVLAGGGHPQ